MSGWALIGFALGVLFPLVMVFPKQELMQRTGQQKLGDPLTVNYLKNLIFADPKNLEMRFRLVEHLIYLNRVEGIDELLAPLTGSDSFVWQAKAGLLQYRAMVDRDRRDESAAGRDGKPQQITALRSLSKLSWPLPTLIYLAGEADRLHQAEVSAGLYRRITHASASMSAVSLAGQAARELGAGNYELAAHLYFIARDKAVVSGRQREYLLAGAGALLSGNQPVRALREVERHAGNLLDDPATLYALIHFARSANDSSAAVQYSQRLLHLSGMAAPPMAWLQKIDLKWIGIASAQADTGQSSGATGMRPYVKKEYELAFQVFIENGVLSDAWKVADAAVRQSPHEVVWHERLAQLSEWTGKPLQALREWRWLLQHGAGEQAELGILRVAPASNDYDILLEVWQRQASRNNLDEAQWNNLANLYEQTGRQREGIAYFEQRYKQDHLQLQLEIAARLAERTGEDDRASDLYQRLIARYGVRTDWAMKAANYFLRKGEYRKAYALLKSNEQTVDAKDAVYWKAMADLAWQLQRDAEAARNYSRLNESRLNAGGDFRRVSREDFSRLIYLLDDAHQDKKAALAETAYRQFGDLDMLLLALEINADLHNLPAQRRLFEQAAADRKLKVSGSARFFLLRGQYLQAQGESPLARRDLNRASKLAPHDAATHNALLWLLIDTRDASGLRELVARLEAQGEHNNPAYWGALAAASQMLDQPSRALAYYTRQLKQNGEDPLWLVNYADALEQAGQAGMASRVRRHVWLQLRAQQGAQSLRPPYSERMLAVARLALMNGAGDANLALVSLLSQLSPLERRKYTKRASGELTLNWALALGAQNDDMARQSDELVLGWAISREQYGNAKAWLWQRFAQVVRRPEWAEASIGLAQDDTEKLDELLKKRAHGMAVLTRHDVANAVEKKATAQSIIFGAMGDNPYSNEGQQRLQEDMLAVAHTLGATLRDEQLGALHRQVRVARVELRLSQSVRLATEWSQAHQSNDEIFTLGSTPTTEQVASLVLKQHGRWGDTEFALRRRRESADNTVLQVKHEARIAPGLQLTLAAESNADAEESNELRVFGMRDQLRVGLRGELARREYWQMESGWGRYFTQSGAYLGNGQRLSWEVGHKIRLEYPDISVRLNGIHSRFNNAANNVLALPVDDNVYGLCGGVGDGVRFTYSRAWRPYADYCLMRNTVSGIGHNFLLGLTGSVIGRDRLAFTLQQERGGANLVNGSSRVLSLDYGYYF